MKYELFISLRYLKTRKANSFISRISVIGVWIVALSVLIPMVTMSVINGFHDSITEKHINKDYHIQVSKYRFYQTEETINEINRIDELKGRIKLIIPFVRSEALLKYQDGKFFGVKLRGIRQDFYKKDKSFKKNFPLFAGKHELNKKFRVVIGFKLAEQMNLDIDKIAGGGEEIIKVLVAKNKRGIQSENSYRILRLYVSGIFKSGYIEYDRTLAFTSLVTAQNVFNTRIKEEGKAYRTVSGLGIKLKKPEEAEEISQILFNKLNDINISDWKQLNKHLLHAFDWEKKLMSVVLVIMILASFLIIYLNLNIIVMDKKKEIGVLKSFGVGNQTIRNIFIVEGFLIGLMGTIIGSLLSMLLLTSLIEVIEFAELIVNHIRGFIHSIEYVWNNGTVEKFKRWELLSGGLEHLKALPYRIYYSDFAVICFLSILVSIFAAYFPSKKSTLENISEVIRYE